MCLINTALIGNGITICDSFIEWGFKINWKHSMAHLYRCHKLFLVILSSVLSALGQNTWWNFLMHLWLWNIHTHTHTDDCTHTYDTAFTKAWDPFRYLSNWITCLLCWCIWACIADTYIDHGLKLMLRFPHMHSRTVFKLTFNKSTITHKALWLFYDLL